MGIFKAKTSNVQCIKVGVSIGDLRDSKYFPGRSRAHLNFCHIYRAPKAKIVGHISNSEGIRCWLRLVEPRIYINLNYFGTTICVLWHDCVNNEEILLKNRIDVQNSRKPDVFDWHFDFVGRLYTITTNKYYCLWTSENSYYQCYQ